jgi:hypothetical protein
VTQSSGETFLEPLVLVLVMVMVCFRVGMSPGPNQTAADEESENVEEDVDAADPEAKSEHFMAILVECLALLNKVPDTVEVRILSRKIKFIYFFN